jgi:carbamoyl-phosphate synthase large subunit
LNVLFTSAGRRVELLRAFRRAMDAMGLEGARIVATDVDPLAPALRAADRTYLVPRLDSPEYRPALAEVCRRERVGLVFPLIDPDVAALSRLRPLLEETGARVAVCAPAAVSATEDKWLTTRLFRELGLPVQRTWLPGDPELERVEFPVFIKPRRGSASKHSYRVESPEQLRFFLAYVPEPMVQEYLPGPEITTDVVCGLEGRVLGMVSRRRIEVRSGEVSKGVTVLRPDVLEGCRRIAEALPARGPVTVQCLLRDEQAYFTEINARFGGGLPLSIAAGVDAPALVLADALGLPLAPPADGTYRVGLYATRFDDSFFLTEQERGEVAGRRL